LVGASFAPGGEPPPLGYVPDRLVDACWADIDALFLFIGCRCRGLGAWYRLAEA
jgi:hypothetical protein